MNRRLYAISWLCLAFLTFLLLSTILKTNRFYHDSAIYFDLSTYFFKNFTDYNNPIRGYSFPLILAICHIAAKILGQPIMLLYNVFASLAHPFFIVIILPLLIKETFHKEIKLYMVVGFYAMVLLFWYGLIVYPLTDLWAIYFLCSAILIVKTQRAGLWGTIAAGVIIGLTCNVRPIYLCVLPLFIIYVVLKSRKYHKAVALLALILGIFLAWLPQVVINKANFGTFSPMIQTHIVYGGGLYFTQLNLGFTIEKYETDVNNPLSPELFYFNERALSIVEKENLLRNKPFENVSSIFKLFAKYPLDFFSIYAKHIFNGLDNKYPEIYISDYSRSRWMFSLLNYTVIFAPLFLLFINYKTIFDYRAVFYSRENILILSMFVLPVILVVPTQMEVRFFLPIHLFLYIACCFYDYSKQSLFKYKTYFLSALLLYVLFVGLCFYISSRTILAVTY